MFSNAPPEELDAALGAMGQSTEAIETPYNCLLVRSPDGVALVDSGLGAYSAAFEAPAGRLLESLGAEGVTPDQIDFVLISHGHPDHVGGLTAFGRPVFPRARHVVSEVEWGFWTSADAAGFEQLAIAARTELAAIQAAGLLELVGERAAPLPGVTMVAAPGHTPGHMAIELGSGGSGALYVADAFLHALHFERPEWVSAADCIPEATVATRSRLLEQAATVGIPVAGFHLPQVGRVERSNGRFRFAPLP